MQCPCGVSKRACLICRKNELALGNDGMCGFVCLPKDELCDSLNVENMVEEEIEEEEEQMEGFIELKYFAMSCVLILIVLIAIGVHALHKAALQESMAFIIFGMAIGLFIRIWCARASSCRRSACLLSPCLGSPRCVGIPRRAGDNARLFFEESVEFNSDYFFFVLLPPIILEAGYSLKKARFIRNFLSIVAFGAQSPHPPHPHPLFRSSSSDRFLIDVLPALTCRRVDAQRSLAR